MFAFKRLFVALLLVVLTVVAPAQTPAQFKFLGIPVDGSKVQMIRQLKLKGFMYDKELDTLFGQFNGDECEVWVHENHGKVDRVLVVDAFSSDGGQVRSRYNNLIRQFKDNEKYLETEKNEPIPDDEDISQEISVNGKTYEASFYFDPMYGWTDEDKLIMAESLMTNFDAQIESGEYHDLTEEGKQQLIQDVLIQAQQRLIDMVEGQVWFCISQERVGRYRIAIYYDNLKNRPNGEDL